MKGNPPLWRNTVGTRSRIGDVSAGTGPTAFQWDRLAGRSSRLRSAAETSLRRVSTLEQCLTPRRSSLPHQLADALEQEDFERALELAREPGYA